MFVKKAAFHTWADWQVVGLQKVSRVAQMARGCAFIWQHSGLSDMLCSGKQGHMVLLSRRSWDSFYSCLSGMLEQATERTVCSVACADVDVRDEFWTSKCPRGPFLQFHNEVTALIQFTVSASRSWSYPAISYRKKKMVRDSMPVLPLCGTRSMQQLLPGAHPQ